MPKIVASPTERWPGEIELHDPLTLPMFEAWEIAMSEYREAKTMSGQHVVFLRGILQCVKAWRLGGGFPEKPTIETFPAKPMKDRLALLSALITEITNLYTEEGAELPND